MEKLNRTCSKCGELVENETVLKEYLYYCPNCDENLYEFETKEDDEDDELKLEYIASLVKQGFTSGYDPNWSITIQEDENDEDIRLEEVARLVKEGYKSGYSPNWSIEIS